MSRADDLHSRKSTRLWAFPEMTRHRGRRTYADWLRASALGAVRFSFARPISVTCAQSEWDLQIRGAMADFVPEQVDLAKVVRIFERRFGAALPQGYVLGRSMFRDAIVEQLGCSELDAENLVDTMIGLGYLQFDGSPSEAIDNLEPWTISTKEGE